VSKPYRSAEVHAINQAVERVLEFEIKKLGWPPPVAAYSMEDAGFSNTR
jgi:hypothetical protein